METRMGIMEVKLTNLEKGLEEVKEAQQRLHDKVDKYFNGPITSIKEDLVELHEGQAYLKARQELVIKMLGSEEVRDLTKVTASRSTMNVMIAVIANIIVSMGLMIGAYLLGKAHSPDVVQVPTKAETITQDISK